MSYGQNGPWGLRATKTLTSATYTGQTNPYLIASGYANNIFVGDPVVFWNTGAPGNTNGTNGYIISLYDFNTATRTNFQTAPILGIFAGCSFQTTSATNPIDPASPGRMYWPAGTTTLNNLPAIAQIIDDPNVIYDIQTNGTGTGLTQANMAKTAYVAWNLSGSTVQGNTSTGQSLVTLDQSSLATTATYNVKLMRLVPVTGNNSGVPYNNAEVLIQNHFYCTRPAGLGA